MDELATGQIKNLQNLLVIFLKEQNHSEVYFFLKRLSLFLHQVEKFYYEFVQLIINQNLLDNLKEFEQKFDPLFINKSV
jgi:hypothetical protein